MSTMPQNPSSSPEYKFPANSFEEAFGSASPNDRPGWRAKLFNCGCIVALMAVVLAVAAAVPWYGAYARIRQALHVGTVTPPIPRDRLPRPEDIVLCREPRYLLWTSASLAAGSDMPYWLFAVDNVHADLWQVTGGPTGYLWDRVETGADTPEGVRRAVGYVLPTEWLAGLMPEPPVTLNLLAASPLFRECDPTILVDMTSRGSLAAVPVAEVPAAPNGAGSAESPRASTPTPSVSVEPTATSEIPPPTPTALPTNTPLPPTPTSVPPTPTPDGPAGRIAVVVVPANLRLGPGLEHQVQEVLEPGTRIVVLVQSDDGEWWQLTAGSWIHGSLVELENVPDGEDPGSGRVDFLDDVQRLVLLNHALDRINEVRTGRGLEPVTPTYIGAAQAHAYDMVRNHYVSHWNLRLETPYMRHTWAGGHDYSAENVAYMGYPAAGNAACLPPMSTDDIDEMTGRLLASSLHRDNLLNPHHREVSIGLASGCSLKTMVQLFEGEFVRFAVVPQLVDDRLVMEGSLLGGATLKEGAGLLLRWEQPLTGSSKSLLWQTGCRYEPMPVLELVPAGASDSLEPNRIVEREWVRCPSPREADPSLRFPEDVEQMLQHRTGPGFELQTRTVNVMVAGVDIWHEEPGLFRIEADFSQVIDIMGPGIYTVELRGDLFGVAIPLSLYSIFVSAG